MKLPRPNPIFLVLISFCLFYGNILGNNYYFSNSGLDSNSGMSPDKPWETIVKLINVRLTPGDTIFFHRSDVFMGEIVLKYSGTPEQPIVISAYGKGTLPIITGAIDISGWKSYKGKILKTICEKPVLLVYANNKMQTSARYPNNRFLHIQKKLETPGFMDDQLNQPNHYWEGATLRWRGNWLAGNATVLSFVNKKISILKADYDMIFEFAEEKGGYYFENKFEELDTCKEWFYKPDEKTLYYYPGEKIKKEKIQAVVADNGISIDKYINNIVISNLQIQKFAKYGIILQGSNMGIMISECIVHDIEGTGVHIDDNSKNCSITKNEIRNASGRGIYAREPDSLIIKYNKVTNTGSLYGHGFSGVHGMIGICVTVHEVEKHENDLTAKNCLISHNYVDSSGYIGIRCDGNNNIIENNVVKNSMLLLNDGGAIYCFGSWSHHSVFRNNLIVTCIGNSKEGPVLDNMARGIYLDNNTSYMTVEGNTIIDISESAIFINDGNHHDIIKNNTAYNFTYGININAYTEVNKISNNFIAQNTVFGIKSGQFGVRMVNWKYPNIDGMVLWEANNYYNFYEKLLFLINYQNKPEPTIYGYKEWQEKWKNDMDGLCYDDEHLINNCNKSKILYNDTEEIKTFPLADKQYFTLEGQNIDGSMSIKPYCSQIVIYKE